MLINRRLKEKSFTIFVHMGVKFKLTVLPCTITPKPAYIEYKLLSEYLGWTAGLYEPVGAPTAIHSQ